MTKSKDGYCCPCRCSLHLPTGPPGTTPSTGRWSLLQYPQQQRSCCSLCCFWRLPPASCRTGGGARPPGVLPPRPPLRRSNPQMLLLPATRGVRFACTSCCFLKRHICRKPKCLLPSTVHCLACMIIVDIIYTLVPAHRGRRAKCL